MRKTKIKETIFQKRHPPKILFGTNLAFAKFVFDRKAAIDLCRDKFGLRHVETVLDPDFGTALYLTDPKTFRKYHRQVREHARRRGVGIVSSMTFYRDCGAIAHPNAAVRNAAFEVMKSLAVMASEHGAKIVSAAFMTMLREDYENLAGRTRLFAGALDFWKRWLRFGKSFGFHHMLVEMSAQKREGCATIAETREVLEELREYYESDPQHVVRPGLLLDIAHGISPVECPDDGERDYRQWLRAFPRDIHVIHIKNTDSEFLSSWGFTSQSKRKGIFSPDEIICSIRDYLEVDSVCVFLETGIKRGRETGELRGMEEMRLSCERVRLALARAGYKEEPSGHAYGWKGNKHECAKESWRELPRGAARAGMAKD